MSSAGDLTGVVIAEKYELVRLIGHGGMGAVYEGRVKSTLKRCAVKLLLRPELAGDAEVLRRFFREARASGLIQSEHVVTAFDSGIDPAGPFYVMEYLVGEDLQAALRRLGPLNQTAATKILFQAALGLAKAHELGIVHRDVKPANLFLAASDDGEIKVKVLDFGVAKVKMEVFHETTLSVTRTGSILGTPLYMSPEQVKRASSIDASADVWSLGVLLFECLTGALPWGDVGGFGELIAAILTNDLPLLQDIAPWVRPELAEIVHRAMSRDMSHRYQSAEALGRALKPLLPQGTRLNQIEIGPPEAAERSAIAPRLSLADTVMLRPTFRPSSPPKKPRTVFSRQAVRLGAVVALAAGTVGTVAWRLARQTLIEAPAVANPQRTSLGLQSPPAATAPPSVARFTLEISPRDAKVTIDGMSTPLADGNANVIGKLGDTRTVRVSLGAHSVTEKVAITADGLIPAKVGLPPLPAARPKKLDTATTPAGAASSPAPVTSPNVAASASATPALSTEFN